MPPKALGMISGGLDSSLATKLLVDLGVQVEGVHFSTGFCVTEHSRNFKDPERHPVRPNEALRLAAELKIKMHLVDISKNYLPVVKNPKYGYGANMNPCVDCRIFMFQRMKELMKTYDAQFVFTGEVLGQRPKSQHREALKIIETDSGLTGRILRPLSAKLLDPTVPEVKGWVDRSRLLGIQGRSRKEQMALAQGLRLENFPQPAGGCCYLADPKYSERLKDFFDYRGKEKLTHEDVLLLKVGRHLRLSDKIKVIAGRNERENNFLARYEKGRHVFRILDYPAAHVLAEIDGIPDLGDLERIASIAARYSDGKNEERVPVDHEYGGEVRTFYARPAREAELEALRI